MWFEEDLKKWKKAEHEFAYLLLERWASMIQLAPDKKFSDWDIKAKQWMLENYYEVKNDDVSETSGNIWFEYRCNWQPSWIYVSKADFIVYKVDDKFYCISRPKLLIRLEFVNKWRAKWWDNWLADMFIVKKEDFFSLIDRNWWVRKIT